MVVPPRDESAGSEVTVKIKSQRRKSRKLEPLSETNSTHTSHSHFHSSTHSRQSRFSDDHFEIDDDDEESSTHLEPEDSEVLTSPGLQSGDSEIFRWWRQTYNREDLRKTEICCGCCCDFLRACVIVDLVYIAYSIFSLVINCLIQYGDNDWDLRLNFMFPNNNHGSGNTINSDDGIAEYEYDEANGMYERVNWSQNWGDVARTLIIFQNAAGIVFALVGIWGARRFYPWLVLAAGIWYILDTIIGCVFFDFVPAVISGLFAYPHFALFLAVRKGRITPDNYVSTEQYCCDCCSTCVPSGDEDEDGDEEDHRSHHSRHSRHSRH